MCIPTKVSFFAWEAWWGKILTLDQLKKRGKHLANRYPLCGKEEENINHLLLFCTKVQDIWTLLFTIFGVNWVLSGLVRENLEGWQGSFARKKLQMAAPIWLFWIIWRVRNKAVFEDAVPSAQRMKNHFNYTLWSWARLVTNFQSLDITDFLSSLDCV